jgi:DNA-binding protein YbaB
MFNKLKQFKDLRKKAKTMQNALAGESVTVEKGGVRLILNGNLEVVSLSLGELSGASLEKILPGLFNDAIKKVQRIMAEKMRAMGGMGNFGF